MQRIMQVLHEDHINVSRLLDVIDTSLERLTSGNPDGLSLAYKAMRYMTAYPDIYHHPLEDIVFEALVRRSPDTTSVVATLTETEYTPKWQSETERFIDEHRAQIIAEVFGLLQGSKVALTEQGTRFPAWRRLKDLPIASRSDWTRRRWSRALDNAVPGGNELCGRRWRPLS